MNQIIILRFFSLQASIMSFHLFSWPGSDDWQTALIILMLFNKMKKNNVNADRLVCQSPNFRWDLNYLPLHSHSSILAQDWSGSSEWKSSTNKWPSSFRQFRFGLENDNLGQNMAYIRLWNFVEANPSRGSTVIKGESGSNNDFPSELSALVFPKK